jgi:hypothetical protein
VVGSGKSGILNVIIAALAACEDVVIWGIDLKGGTELRPWTPSLGRLATTPEQTVWHAHALDAPGKFLTSAPEHHSPKRARAYLITDADIADTARRHAAGRPVLNAPHRTSDGPQSDPPEPDERLRRALLTAPDACISVPELVKITGISRPTLYRRLSQLLITGRAIQVSRGRYRGNAE